MGEASASRRASRLLFPVCVSLLSFSNSLDGAFVIDDGSAVRTNQDLRPETPLSQLLVRDFWGRPIDAPTSVKSYRPLTVLTFRWNFSAHGQYTVTVFSAALWPQRERVAHRVRSFHPGVLGRARVQRASHPAPP